MFTLPYRLRSCACRQFASTSADSIYFSPFRWRAGYLPAVSRLRFVAVGALLLGLASCKDAAGPSREINGQEVYVRHCSRCHGIDGKGVAGQGSAVTPPDLTSAAFQRSTSDEKIKGIILQGKPPQMPGFSGQFIEPTVAVLVRYVRELGRTPAPSVSTPAP